MKLPDLVYQVTKNKLKTVKMGNINYTDMLNDGDIVESHNISSKRYPYITTNCVVAGELPVGSTNGSQHITSYQGKSVVYDESTTKLFYDGTLIDRFTNGAYDLKVTQMVWFQRELIIWGKDSPLNSLYIDFAEENMKLRPMSRAIQSQGCTSAGYTITANESIDFDDEFDEGDTITVTSQYGSTKADYTITTISGNVIIVKESVGSLWTTENTVTFRRKFPSLDYICEHDNRIFGTCSSEKTVYYSELGQPRQFYKTGTDAGSYTVAVASDGDFTGCIGYSSSVLFFKEHQLFKLLGSYPSEYALYSYKTEGVAENMNGSLNIANEVLYYVGSDGVYAYSGGMPQLVLNLGENAPKFQEDNSLLCARSIANGSNYFLLYNHKEQGVFKADLLRYDVNIGIWSQEYSFDCNGGKPWMSYVDDVPAIITTEVSDDNLFYITNGDTDEEWSLRFAPFYETIEGRKLYSKLTFRVELPKGSYMNILVRQDNKLWKEVAKIKGKEENAISVRIPITRCDKFDLKLEGKGKCTIFQILREVAIGSDV